MTEFMSNGGDVDFLDGNYYGSWSGGTSASASLNLESDPNDNDNLDMDDMLTIAAWVYPILGEAESTILMKGQYGYGFALTWDGDENCSVNNAQNLVYWDQGNCWDAINSVIQYEPDIWQHVAVTVEDVGEQLEIYF